jgi:hypothetical protein
MRLPEWLPRAALAFALVLLVAGPPWPPLRRAFASAYCAVMNTAFGGVTFGQGGRVHFTTGDGRRPPGEVSTDALLAVSVERFQGNLIIGLNARRDGYLPLVVLLAATAALPFGLRRRLRCLLLGAAVEGAVVVLSMGLFVVWQFAIGLHLRGIYELGPTALGGLDLAFRALLLPPGNRFVLPLLIVAVAAWVSGAGAAAPARPHPAAPPRPAEGGAGAAGSA